MTRKKFVPTNEQEASDQKIILSYIQQYAHNVLLRDNPIAHITSSGFLMNKQLDKVLLVHHNIRNVWAWTEGHADGDSDLLHVAIKEARALLSMHTCIFPSHTFLFAMKKRR